MKTYQSKQHGFEIAVPEVWLLPRGESIKSAVGHAIVFCCGAGENCNIEIGRSICDQVEVVERAFRRYATARGYTELELGTISAGGREHVWARYHMGARDWAKKYLIVFGDTEYAITTNCCDRQRFAEREPVWDSVAQSFRLIPREEPATTTDKMERVERALRFWETGYRHFQAGRYRKALEQFERGKMVTHEVATNFMGASMTIMPVSYTHLTLPTKRIV